MTFRGAVQAAAVALFLFGVVAPVGVVRGKDKHGPDLEDCENLEVPAGNKLTFWSFAVGVQVYRWDGAAWVFVAPEAVLFDWSGFVGIHYVGPTWESESGSKVVGAVVERCTVDPKAIPWLLLRAVSAEGKGPFRRVTYIQRVNTTGGLAPAARGAFPGQVARVPYTAEYYFYRGH